MSIESEGRRIFERMEDAKDPTKKARCHCPKCGHNKARKKTKGWFCRKCGFFLGLELKPEVEEELRVKSRSSLFASVRRGLAFFFPFLRRRE